MTQNATVHTYCDREANLSPLAAAVKGLPPPICMLRVPYLMHQQGKKIMQETKYGWSYELEKSSNLQYNSARFLGEAFSLTKN